MFILKWENESVAIAVVFNFHVIVISTHYVGFKCVCSESGGKWWFIRIWITIKNYYGNEGIVIFSLRTNDDFFISFT